MALDHGLARRHADDDVGEVASGGLAQAQPVELDVGPQRGDRALGEDSRLDRRTVHQHVRVRCDQAHRGDEDDHRDEQRRDGVAVVESRLRGEQAGEHEQRAGDVGCEVQRRSSAAWGCLRGRRPPARRPCARLRAISATPITASSYQCTFASVALPVRRVIASTLTSTPPASSMRGLAERAEVLGAAVAVGVLEVGGPAAEVDREERQHGGDHVAARLDARSRSSPRLPVARPTPSLRATSSVAAATDTSVLARRVSRRVSPVCNMAERLRSACVVSWANDP